MPPGQRAVCCGHPIPVHPAHLLVPAGLSTFGRTILKPAPRPLAAPFISDLLRFFSFPILLADLLLFSINLFSVLSVLSHQLCGGFTALPYLLLAPCFAEPLNKAFFYSLQAAWRPLASWATPLRGLGPAFFFPLLTHLLNFTRSFVLKLNNHVLDLVSLLFLTIKLKPSGITAGLDCPRAKPVLCKSGSRTATSPGGSQAASGGMAP